MNGKNLFRALEYVDDRYLDIADAALQEATDMKQKHFSGRKTIPVSYTHLTLPTNSRV